MNIGTFYKFTFTNPTTATEYIRAGFQGCIINRAEVIHQGFINLWSYDPEKTAAKFGGATYEKITK